MEDECKEFFSSCPAPANLADVEQKTKEFIGTHEGKKPVVLVTSGGTTAPLERNTVRFIDNFSSGLRGSSSAEYFLSCGYAVIFLHRDSSLKPFQRHFKDCNILEWFSVACDNHGTSTLSLTCDAHVTSKLSQVVTAHDKTKQDSSLLCLPFKTIFDYLYYLRGVSCLLGTGMAYLAAAVADFYVSYDDMVEHKIQSSGSLTAHFSRTPKMLSQLTQKWAPKAYVVTFKLETDNTLLLDKAKAGLVKYGNQAVVANLLGTHRTMATVISRASHTPNSVNADIMKCGVVGGCHSVCDEEDQKWEAMELRLSKEDVAKHVELESLIVQDLVARHHNYIQLCVPK